MDENERKMDRLAVFEPYDMDTGLGTNNSGVLMFGYSLEDIDTVDSVISGSGSDAPVYNAQDSVLWNNIRDAFRSELIQMYRNLRADKVWSYKIIETLFEEHQSKWPEAIFNEDAYIKYIVPLVEKVTQDDNGNWIYTDRYLTMLQGSKEEQRKWWLYNRFRYLDSKYNTGDASINTINLRIFNAGSVSITPAIDLYVGVSFGGGTTPQLARTKANEPATFTYASETGVNELETWIYSADLITSVGDLSVFLPNECDFSNATRLRELKIGDPNITNTHLRTINVQNCRLLEKIDCRNCPNLNITVDLENSPRLAEAYFEDTSITGVDIADGGSLETLHLPGTVTSLMLLNLNKLSDFQIASYSNITTLMLANIDQSVVDPFTVLNNVQAGTLVNIQGLSASYNSIQDIETFYDLLDIMKGVTRERVEGVWIYHETAKAIVGGTIRLPGTIYYRDIASLVTRYPDITITADRIVTELKYYNYDGTVLYTTQTIQNGEDGTYTGTPARDSDAQYVYAFNGWSLQKNGDADPQATKRIIEDRNVYAAYTKTIRTYTVRFMNGTTILETYNNVPYGETVTYSGEEPVHPTDPDDYSFGGWNPDISVGIVGATDYQPVWVYSGIISRELISRTFSKAIINSDAEKVGAYAFYSMQLQGDLFFQSAEQINENAFFNCRDISSIDLPVATSIGTAAFQSCIRLNSFSAPEVTLISKYAFSGCESLISLYIPKVEYIDASAFLQCKMIPNIYIPNVSMISNSAFYNCATLETIVVGINYSSVCILGANAFSLITDLQHIYVPESLVSEYKNATNWASLADKIEAYEEN